MTIKTGAHTKISQRHKGHRSHLGIRWYRNGKIVGGRRVFSAPRNEKSHRLHDVYGKGSSVLHPKKQKLNTKISTEAELVGVDDLMPQIIWMRYSLEAQGMKVSDNVVYPYNRSEMKLEDNRRASIGNKNRHINIWYYLVNDRFQANEMKMEYCPTEMMIADFYMKPLQGNFI